MTTTKRRGFHLDSDLSGETHIEDVVRKAFTPKISEHLVTIYTAVVRPLLEYASVFVVGVRLKPGCIAGKDAKKVCPEQQQDKSPHGVQTLVVVMRLIE
ncbi:hypothetical protein VZT92_008480 [Zoarces viviparus]|uniref:Uncharacterized protein n=1 Tax=Zoarces viviparus TaxID=48416 RepID=A0AAW1FGL4_ZOAVI